MCKNLINLLAAIGKDKYMHFTVSLLIMLFLYAIAHACGLGVYSVVPALVIALAVGFIKEKLDAKKGGIFDPYDIVADFLGCFVGAVLVALLLI